MKFFKEFKEFISRGNVVDMAVGVIIGGAFSAIVTALTNKILMPIINWVLFLISGGKGMDSIYTYLHEEWTVNELGEEIHDLANSIYIDWGAFITAILNFILIALVLFIIIKAINKAHQHAEELKAKREAKDAVETVTEPQPEPQPAAPSVDEQQLALLEEIRDLMKKQ